MRKLKLILVILLFLLSTGVIGAQDILNAVRKQNIEEVKRYLAIDSSLISTKDEFQNDLLFLAILNKDIKMAELLLEHGIGVSYSRKDVGFSALHTSVQTGPVEMVNLLLSFGADINKKDLSGNTPLSNAILCGQKEIAYLLADKGAPLSVEKSKTEIILRSLLAGGMERFIDQIVSDTTIDYFKKTRSGDTYLHAAAQGGVINFAEKLIQRGLYINEKNIYGWSPIHIAASEGQTGIIGLLIKYGAEKNIRTNDGKTPFNIAQDFEQKQMQDFLQQKGFDRSKSLFPNLQSKYVDPVLPDTIPLLFAPGIVSRIHTFEHCMLTFSLDFHSMCWADWNTNGISKIFLMEKKNGKWESPQIVQLHATNPCISPDGKRIFFTARRISSGGEKLQDNDIFYIEKKGKNWSEPVNVGASVNTENDDIMPSVDNNGTLYFVYNADIYRSKFINGKYSPKERLPYPVNSERAENEPFISKDGSFLIFRSVGTEGMMVPNVYISFHNSDDTWTIPINLAEKIYLNGLFPALTPDFKYLFFFRQDYYWASAKIIEELRQKE